MIDWTAVHMLSLARYVVSRASSRIFVGPRLCQSIREPTLRYAMLIV